MDLIDDCERFVLRSFDGVKQSAMHIYHSALSWTPTSSPTRQLYGCELMTETKLVNAVGPAWDTCIRIIPTAVIKSMRGVVFSPSGALIAAHGKCCVQVFDAMTGVNRVTFDEDKSISSVSFSPDDSSLVSELWGGTMNVWDVQTGTMFRTFKWNMPWHSACLVVFSSCGKMIASGGSDGIVRIWNILSGGCNCIFQGHSRAVMDVCWLATWNQVVSASVDRTVHIWDIQKQTCLKIFARYNSPVNALAFLQGLLLVASTDGTVIIHDSQSGDIIHIIRSSSATRSRLSIDRAKVLVANRNVGDIWDITTKTLMRARSIDYNGEHAMFSLDGTRIASIYGKFLKIWKTDAGKNHHKVSTPERNTIDDIYISPDERLVTLKSNMGADILDATTGQSLFTYPITDFLSIGLSLDLKIVAFLRFSGIVQIWDARIRHHKSIAVDGDVFHIALSPNGSQLASLSSSHMKLWDLKSERWLAHLEFDKQLQVQAPILFVPGATSVSVLTNRGTKSCHISPNHNIGNHIMNHDSTTSWLISRNPNTIQTRNRMKNCDGTRLPMVFVPKWSNQSAFVPCQSYRCDMDDEWILDQDGRRVLWIPPDERPRKFLCFEHEKKVLVLTEGGKVYFFNFL